MGSYGPKTVTKTPRVLIRTLLGFSCNNYVGVARVVRPHLDYRTRAVEAANSLLGRSSLMIVFSINLVQQRMLLRI